MIVQNKIDKLLRDNLNVSKLIIRNDSNKHNVPPNSESHFNVQIVSDDFKDLSQIQRHKIVYKYKHHAQFHSYLYIHLGKMRN